MGIDMSEENSPFRDLMELYLYAQDGESWIEPVISDGSLTRRWDKQGRYWVRSNNTIASAPEKPSMWRPCAPPPEPTEGVEVYVNVHAITTAEGAEKAGLTVFVKKADASSVGRLTRPILEAYPVTIKLPASVAEKIKGST